jgi:hypothetical protein
MEDENVKSSIQKQAKLINSEPLDISQEGVHFEKGRSPSQFVSFDTFGNENVTNAEVYDFINKYLKFQISDLYDRPCYQM